MVHTVESESASSIPFVSSRVRCLTHNPDDLKDRTLEIKDSHKYTALRDCQVNKERIVGLEDRLKKS